MLTLLLLQGMDGTGELFDPFIAAVSSDIKVKVIRYPTDQPLNYAELEAHIRARFTPEGPYVIVGESFSGPIAVSIAANAPGELIGLVLCCTFVRNPRPALSCLRAIVDCFPIALMPMSVANYFLLGRFATRALRTALACALRQVPPATLRARLRAVLTADVRAKFSVVRVPVLYLRAVHDRLVPKSASRLVTALNPHAKLVEFESPHFLLQTAPERAAQTIESFIHGFRQT